MKKTIVDETKVNKKDEYHLKITLGSNVFEGKGATALEALKSITPPVKIFTKGDIELKYGKMSMKQTWLPNKIKRLFFPLAQNIITKQLIYLLR